MSMRQWPKKPERPEFWIYSQAYLAPRAYCWSDLCEPPYVVCGGRDDRYYVLVTLPCDDFRIPGTYHSLGKYDTAEQAWFVARQCIETERTRSCDWYTLPEQDEVDRLMQLTAQP